MRKSLKTGLATLLLSTGACTTLQESLTPDKIELGASLRQAQANYGPLKAEGYIPLGRITAIKTLDEKTDFYAKLEYTKAQLTVSGDGMTGSVRGHMEGLGLGLNYNPFSENIEFKLGVEAHHIKGAAFGRLDNLGKIRIKDSAVVWGLNAGVSTNIPLSKRTDLILSGEYHLTDEHLNNAHLDLNGFSGYLGFRIKLGR